MCSGLWGALKDSGVFYQVTWWTGCVCGRRCWDLSRLWRQLLYVISCHDSWCTDLEYWFFLTGKTSAGISPERLFVSPEEVKSQGGWIWRDWVIPNLWKPLFSPFSGIKMVLSHQGCPLVWFTSNYRSQLKPKCQNPSWRQVAIALLQILWMALAIDWLKLDSNQHHSSDKLFTPFLTPWMFPCLFAWAILADWTVLGCWFLPCLWLLPGLCSGCGLLLQQQAVLSQTLALKQGC